MKIFFSPGLELGNLVVSSGILQRSWNAILKLDEETKQSSSLASSSIKYGFFKHKKCIIVVFATSPSIAKKNLQGEKALVASSDPNLKIFDFLSTPDYPSFALNKTVVDLFNSSYVELDKLKSKVLESNEAVITGQSLGGSVASLFTLLLLNSVDPTRREKKLPICVTFGSPLIGDDGLQSVISQFSPWDSCFLHVVSDKDPVPRIVVPRNTESSDYKPFGKYLLCSDKGCACFDDSEAILKLLVKSNCANQSCDYGKIIKTLEDKLIFKDNVGSTLSTDWATNPLGTGLIAQIQATGVDHQDIEMEALGRSMEANIIHRRHRNSSITKEANDRLNNIKVHMARLEWYKKTAKNGYYDRFKYVNDRPDQDALGFKRALNKYWEQIVAEAERMPRVVKTKYLFGGTNYRRMVEPLDIAKYYEDGNRNYLTEGRFSEPYKHYIKLEELLKGSERNTTSGLNQRKKQNVASILTEDSCFYAHVEEAIIGCKTLKNGEASAEEKNEAQEILLEFEKYVMKLINNYAVNPEIFLEGNSFMKWWKEYEAMGVNPYNQDHGPLTSFMKKDYYKKYINGSYEIGLLAFGRLSLQ